ncbi:MAG TPA: tetratricopeptide repeat protein, partial [Pirellulales bacterium]|nr:tetratricopeptide repeat protein [Pirellulales bacterium]
DFDESHGAFVDTAAVMASLDLVITSDTAVAHLAGGMGVPVGVLLPHAADWRWLIEVEVSPWYPTMRLFRQAVPGDWNEVVSRVAGSVRRLVERRVPGQAIDRYPRVARALVDRGVHSAEAGQLEEAVALFRRALRYEPDLPEAYNNLGNALRGLGRLDEATANLERAIDLAPDYAEARHNLGIVLARLRRHEEAILQFKEAIDRKPDFALAWTSLGLSQAELRRYADAEASFRRALEIEPRSPRVLNNLGNVLSDQGRRQDAVVELRRAIEIDPRCVDAHNNLGNALRELGKPVEAIASFERALSIRPEFPEAHNNMGIAWAAKGDYERAVASYREALHIWPEYPAAHNNLGIALGHQKQFTDSIASYRRALELKPDYAEAYNNLGIALSQDGEHEEAIACFRRAIELKPEYAEAYSNLGITLTELGQLEEALASYNEALRLKPNYPDAYMNRALASLVRGDFERGWQEYESRWQCKDFKPRGFKQPQWNGEPLEGRRILLHAEQGFGDTFQFARYARLVKEERGGMVIVWCPKPLVPLVSQCPYVDEATIEGDKLPEFDCHLPLLSLPKIFGTTLDAVPRDVPYLFAKPELIDRWREELSYIDAFKIGINWQGNPRYRGDRHRSIPLEQFAPLASIPGVRLISLQKGLGTEQIAKVSSKCPLTELGAHRDETGGAFMDTAAILMNLDLVISSDTSLVHLAGGLGVPVWVALPWAADWRWLLERDDSPWYPTMRLFRQRELGEWEELFDRMGGEVWELVKRRRREGSAPLSAGELLDRTAALECQVQLGANGHAPAELERKLNQLSEACRDRVPESEELYRLRAELKATNEKLQRLECEAQECEAADDSSPRFSELLKSLRQLDKERAAIKQAIDEAADRELQTVSYAALSQRLRGRDQQAENSGQTVDHPRDASESLAPPANGRVNGSGTEQRPAGDAQDAFAVFDRIYRNGGWCGKGSGPGSAPDASKSYIGLLNRLVNQTPDIRSILDIGCGDWQIMCHVDLSRKRYLGVDVAASVVAANAREFGRENIRFQVLNPYLDDIPEADLIMMKDVAQHLPTAYVRKILERIAARCRYALIANDFTEHNVAREIPVGGWRPVNVLAPPFNLPGVTLAVWNGKHVTLSTFGR